MSVHSCYLSILYPITNTSTERTQYESRNYIYPSNTNAIVNTKVLFDYAFFREKKIVICVSDLVRSAAKCMRYCSTTTCIDRLLSHIVSRVECREINIQN